MRCLQDGDGAFGPQYCDQFDFTLLFEQSIFQISPCAVFLLLLPLRMSQLRRQDVKLKRNRMQAVKLAATTALAATQLALLLAWAASPAFRTIASIPASTLSFSAALALLYLSHVEHARSIRPSSIINIYTLFSLLFDIPQARTLWLRPIPHFVPAIYTTGVFAKVLVLVLEARSKRRWLRAPYRVYPPEFLVSIYNRTALWWLNPLFLQGYRGSISFDTLFVLDADLTSEQLEKRFRECLSKRLSSTKYPLIRAICTSLLRTIIGVLAARLSLSALRMSQPLLTLQITSWLSDENRGVNSGRLIVAASVLLYLALPLTNVIFKRCIDRLITKIRAIVISSLHSKCLTLQSDLADDGMVASLLSTDTIRITAAIPDIVELLAAPVEIGVSVFLLQRQVGLSCIAPVVLSITISLVSFLNTSRAMPYQKQWMTAIKERIVYTAAVLGCPKGFKMLGLTVYLSEQIQALRVLELAKYAAYRKFVAIRNVMAFIPDEFAPPVTLTMFALINESKTLTPSTAFTSLSLVLLLVKPIHSSIQAIPEVMSFLASVDRVGEYILQESGHLGIFRNPSDFVTHDRAFGMTTDIDLANMPATREAKESIVELHNVTVNLGKEERPILQSVSLTIASRAFTIIAGPVGSGKSTLLRAIIGDVCCTTGNRIVSRGESEFGYCAQETWLPNDSVQDTILGVSEYNETWYRSVIEVCALNEDLASFPHGGKTMIGSRGLSLSGGQKQRLALARALYSRKKVLVLDDVLSGVDAKVSKSIITSLSAFCKNNGITLILATNATHHFRYADHIVILGHNGIVDQGSFATLSSKVDNSLDIGTVVDGHESNRTHGEIASLPKDMVVSSKADDEPAQELARRTGDMAVYRYYAASIGWKLGFAIIASSAIATFSEKFPDLLVRWWSEDEVTPAPRHSSGFWIGLYFGLAILAIVSIFWHLWIFLVWTIPKSSATLHQQLLKSVMNASHSFFVNTDAGVILNHFATDMSLIELQLASSVIRTLTGLGTCIAAAAFIAAGASYAGVLMPFLIAILCAVQKFYLRTSRQLRFMDIEAQAPLLAHCQETELGVSTIRAFGWQHDSHQKCIALLDRSQRPYYLLLCAQRWLNLLLDLVTGVIAIVVVIFATTIRHTASASSIGLSLLNVLSFNTQLAELIVAWTDLETSLGAVARCRNLSLNTAPEHLAGENALPPSDWPNTGCLQLLNVTAAYTMESEQVLKNITLIIPGGSKVGICGRSGSGKSSLLLTLFRMLDSFSGQVYVDNVDLTTVPRNILRNRFTALPQDALCVPGSVKANLDPGNKHSSEELYSVLLNVGLLDLVNSRGGQDGDLGKIGLSPGEMQLFAVARALLSPSKLLVVDEMTSAIDSTTEEKILELMMTAFRESTVVAVAHRLSTIINFDLLVVLDHGRIVEFGPPQELMKKEEGLFRKMWETTL